jgi:hypothetical protein
VFVREAIVQVLLASSRAFEILAWRQGTPTNIPKTLPSASVRRDASKGNSTIGAVESKK